VKIFLGLKSVYVNQKHKVSEAINVTDSAWPIKIKRTSSNQEMVKCKDLARMPGVREARNPLSAFLTNEGVTDILIIFVKCPIHWQNVGCYIEVVLSFISCYSTVTVYHLSKYYIYR